MADEERKAQEGEERLSGETDAGAEQGGDSLSTQQESGLSLESTSGTESPAPESDPPIIVQGGGSV